MNAIGLILTFLFMSTAVFLGTNLGRSDTQDLSKLPANIIEVIGDPEIEAMPIPCNILEKIDDEYDKKLASLDLKVGVENIAYSEERLAIVGAQLKIAQRNLSDPIKEIGLKVLNLKNCRTDIVTITKVGDELVAPKGWRIEPVTRSNGIRWNNWNTEFNIIQPANSVVLKNRYPFVSHETVAKKIKTAKGKTKTVWEQEQVVEYLTYAPYSRGVHRPEVVERGRQYLTVLIENAYAELKKKKVYSRAFPDKLVTDVPLFSRASFERLPIIEHNDMAEFMADPHRASERVLVLLGMNGANTFSYTCSGAGACGLYQFTDNWSRNRRQPGTYTAIRQKYPRAKLESDFVEGAKDHLNVAQAAILLYDNNLEYVLNRYGPKLLRDKKVEEYLAALYNASPKSVTASLDPALRRDKGEWANELLSETKGYIVKLRFLIEHNFFTPSVMQPPINP